MSTLAITAEVNRRVARRRGTPTQVEQLAQFVCQAKWEMISEPAREQLKLRILDSLGVALGALDGEPVAMVRAHVQEFGGAPLATLIGSGKSAPDRAALYNGALVRYLDFNDSYLAAGETCHPSDNLAPILAAAEYARADGPTLLTALAVAYQVQTRLSEVAPVRAKGFDHTTQGAYAVAAGVARALGLDERQTANAIAIAGTSLNALRVTRTGELSHWKGLAYPAAAFAATQAAFLAMRGVTGPREVFEGNKGFIESIAGPFEIDWSEENLEAVRHTILKKYNAEIHSQSAIEALLALRSQYDLRADEVRADRARHLPSRLRHHRRWRGGREAVGRTARRRPTTRCRTCWQWRCSTGRCCRLNTCVSGSSPTMSRNYCAASWCAPATTSLRVFRPSTVPVFGCARATGGASSASSTTTKAFTRAR